MAHGCIFRVRLGASSPMPVSHEIIDTLNIPGAVAESPDGKLAALVTDSLIIFRRCDSSRVLTLPDGSSAGMFTKDSKHFLTTGAGPVDRYVICATLSGNVGAVRKTFDSCSVFAVGGNSDATRWFLYVVYDLWVCGFLVYDVRTDSIIYRHTLIPGSGFIAVTNNYVVYTNGGSIMVGPPPPSEFYIYDIKANALAATVSTVGAKVGRIQLFCHQRGSGDSGRQRHPSIAGRVGRTLSHYSLSQMRCSTISRWRRYKSPGLGLSVRQVKEQYNLGTRLARRANSSSV